LIWSVFTLLFGLVIGSFLNVCIYRIPRHESIVYPGSRCPSCLRPIKIWDNIPILSFILLRGKCRYCGARISLRYPLVEISSALLALGILYRFGPNLTFIIYYTWSCALMVITFIDLDYQIIPNNISIGGIVLGLLLNFWLPISLKDALIGGGLGAGILLAVIYGYFIITRREGMGLGDVKLLAMIGVFIGWHGVIVTILVSSLAGSVVGIIWVLLTKKDMKTAIPFGPFLSLGAIIYLFWGQELINMYLGFMSY